MPVVISLVGAALAALVVVIVAETTSRHTLIADTEGSERWLVDRIARLPGLRRTIATIDRFVWGGAMVAIGIVATTAAAAVVGWILSTVDDESGFARFDESVAEWGADQATSMSTDVLQAVTRLGETWLLLIVMAVVGFAAVLRSADRHWGMLGFLAAVGIGVSAVNNGLKWLVMRDRPEVDHLVGSGGSSFPSGHSAAAAACWAAIAIVVSRRMRPGTRRWAMAVAVAVAVLVAASRVLLGVHWLTDVIAGVLVGWTWAFLVALVFGGRIQRFGEPAERVSAADERANSQAGDHLITTETATSGTRSREHGGFPS